MGLGRMLFGGAPKGKWVRADKPSNPIPVIIGTLIFVGLLYPMSQCAGGEKRPTEPPNLDRTPQTAAPPTGHTCPIDFFPETPGAANSGWTAKRTIALPNLEGMNGQKAKQFLEGRGISDVRTSSDNPQY